jgi:thymidylate kinase
MKKGKLFVIEGIDGSGKGTQLKLLSERLKKKGHKILSQDFPRYYTSPWGKMVGEFLAEKYGKFTNIDPHLVFPLYMLDQYTWGRDVGQKFLEKGGTIILDRFFTSNVHQIAKKKGRAKKDFRDWLWNLGYNELKIIKPDLVLFLDVPVTITKKLIKLKSDRAYLKGKKKDGAEKNWEHQEASYKEYKYTVKSNKNWVEIKCVTKGKLDEPDVISEKIWKMVSRVI